MTSIVKSAWRSKLIFSRVMCAPSKSWNDRLVKYLQRSEVKSISSFWKHTSLKPLRVLVLSSALLIWEPLECQKLTCKNLPWISKRSPSLKLLRHLTVMKWLAWLISSKRCRMVNSQRKVFTTSLRVLSSHRFSPGTLKTWETWAENSTSVKRKSKRMLTSFEKDHKTCSTVPTSSWVVRWPTRDCSKLRIWIN